MTYTKNPLWRFIEGCECPDCATYLVAELSGPMGKADFTVDGAGVARCAPEILPPLRDKTSAERKAEPVYSGCLMYFPDALAAVARHSLKANEKHNGPDAPLGWSRGKSTDQMDAATRHSLTPNAIDPDTKEAELVGMAWRALAQLQLDEEQRNKARGVRSYSGL